MRKKTLGGIAFLTVWMCGYVLVEYGFQVENTMWLMFFGAVVFAVAEAIRGALTE